MASKSDLYKSIDRLNEQLKELRKRRDDLYLKYKEADGRAWKYAMSADQASDTVEKLEGKVYSLEKELEELRPKAFGWQSKKYVVRVRSQDGDEYWDSGQYDTVELAQWKARQILVETEAERAEVWESARRRVNEEGKVYVAVGDIWKGLF